MGLTLRSGSAQLANALLWPPPVPADCSSVPFGRPKRCKPSAAAPHSLQTLYHLCRLTLFLGVQLCRLAALKGCAAAPHSLQTRCCGHHLCRQTLFLRVQVCRLAALKGSAAAPHSLQTRCCGHHRSGSTQLANALLWPPPVPADSFLGGSSVPFGRLKRLRSGSTL